MINLSNFDIKLKTLGFVNLIMHETAYGSKYATAQVFFILVLLSIMLMGIGHEFVLCMYQYFIQIIKLFKSFKSYMDYIW